MSRSTSVNTHSCPSPGQKDEIDGLDDGIITEIRFLRR